jgi:hypothetical protein
MSLPASPAEELHHSAQPSLASLNGHDTLSQAIAGQQRPGRLTLTRALLDQERQAKQQRWTMAVDDLLGTWQLCFTAPGKPTYKSGQPTGQGFYIPGLIRATLGFSKDPEQPTGLTIQNQLQIALLKLRFTGPARVLPQKNLVAFDFDRLQLMIGNLTLLSIPVRAGRSQQTSFEETPVGKLPFFSFFATTKPYLAARGRGGGLALWKQSS